MLDYPPIFFLFSLIVVGLSAQVRALLRRRLS